MSMHIRSLVLLAGLSACDAHPNDPLDHPIGGAEPPLTFGLQADLQIGMAPDAPNGNMRPAQNRWIQIEGNTEVVCDEPDTRARSYWDEWGVEPMDLPESGIYRMVGGAVAMEDFNGDGFLDLMIGGHLSARLLFGDGSELVEAPLTHLPEAGAVEDIVAFGAGDFDADGDLDLVVSLYEGAPQLWENDGTGVFVDASVDADMPTLGDKYLGVAVGDMDGDQDMDIYIGGYGAHTATTPNGSYVGVDDLLLRNDGTARFTNAAHEIPDDVHEGYSFGGAFQDANDDGLQDLLIMHDFGYHVPSQVMWNDGYNLTPDEQGEAGLNYVLSSMGLAIADINHDGIPDFAHSSYANQALLISGVDGWADYTMSNGFDVRIQYPYQQLFGWGTEFADFNNDGMHDIIVGYGYWEEYQSTVLEHDGLWIQTEALLWTDMAGSWNMDHGGPTRGIAVGDLNRDGWPDVVKRFVDGTTTVHVSRCGENNWLNLRLRDESMNTFAVGAKVEVTTANKTRTAWVRGGGTSIFSVSSGELHFGLADAEIADEIRITWPDGQTHVLTHIDVNRHLTITRRSRDWKGPDLED